MIPSLIKRTLWIGGFILLLIIPITLNAQKREQWISAQTGVFIESSGLRFWEAYERNISENWHWGIGADLNLISGLGAQYDEGTSPVDQYPSYLTVNLYRRINIIKDRWFWNLGVGAGTKIGFYVRPVFTASAIMNVRLTPRLYLELPFSPFPAIGRYYLTPYYPVGNKTTYEENIVALTIGLKFKL